MADAKYSNGRLFRIFTGSPICIDKKYSIGPCCKKDCDDPNRSPQPYSCNTRHPFRTCRTRCYRRLSRSPDLRINSSVGPSQLTPMTGFRLPQCLHAYSGGTVRDLHPVVYSPVALLPQPQALKRNIYFCYSIHDSLPNVNHKKCILLLHFTE